MSRRHRRRTGPRRTALVAGVVLSLLGLAVMRPWGDPASAHGRDTAWSGGWGEGRGWGDGWGRHRPAPSPSGAPAPAPTTATPPPPGTITPPAPAPSSGSPAPTTTPATGPTTGPTTEPPAGPPSGASGKGASIWKSAGMAAALADSGSRWFYSWGPDPKGVSASGVEFVPMIWDETHANAGELATAKSAGGTLLGFNEPDLGGQANMTVEQALELWPQLDGTGMRLGAPAVASGADVPGQWLDRFMASAGGTVDFVPLHWYGGNFTDAAASAEDLRGYVERVHARYGKPIWVTEFALLRFPGGGLEYATPEQEAAFVSAATAMLNGLPYVERYAWFSLSTPDEGGDGSGLYRPDGSRTPAGDAYRAA